MVKPEKIHSLRDLEMEKERLKLEILKTETNIRSDYHNLLHAFTFKNLASSVIQDITTTSSVVSKAFSIGKSFLGKKKKRKKEHGPEPHDPDDF
jgi:hypothetical protein